MLLVKQWKNEKETLHHLSQILGKYKMSSSFKEPQWAHVILDVTTTGFSTGMLFYGENTYELAVNLRDHKIEVITDTETHTIPLEDGKTIEYYDEEIEKALKDQGIVIEINKKPQEIEDETLFNEDTIHHHYNEEISIKALELMQFSIKVQLKFLGQYRTRKVYPGLFWGTFDISCLINYNEVHRSFDDSKVISSNAFDEHFIEYGFWFGDDRFEGPTFFILPHPFVDENFTYDAEMPEEAYFDEVLGEFMFEIKDTSDKTAKKVVQFMRIGYDIFKKYLNWEDSEYYSLPLNIEDNQLDKSWDF